MSAGIVHAGIVLPVEVLQSDGFALLAVFVAVNSLIFLGFAVLKILPAPRPPRRRRERRTETRSIYPDGPL